MISDSKILVTTDPTFLDEHEEAWRTLLGEAHSVYVDPVWYRVWWAAFGKEKVPQLLYVPGSFYLPMMLEKGTLSMMGNVYSHRHHPAYVETMDGWVESLVQHWESCNEWDSVSLKHVCEDSAWGQSLRKVLTNRPGWTESFGEAEIWAVPDGSWSDHLHAQGRESRKKRRKVRRRLEEHNVRVQVYTTEEDAKAFARIYFRLMVRSWKKPDSSRDFFRKLCRTTAEQGWFRSYVLFMDEEPTAFQLGFLNNGVFSCYKTAYDPKFAGLSPGIAVMDFAFEDAFQQGAHSIDLLTGSGAYKSLWCNRRVQQLEFRFERGH